MTNRRQLLEAGVAAAAWPWTFGVAATPGNESPGGARVEIYSVLYDTRFEASVAFARRAAGRGHAVAATNGDVTRVWYDDLYHRWRQGPAAIAGLTAHGALFCLEQLAIEQRMRVLFRAKHMIRPGAAEHAIEGPASVVTAACEAATTDCWAAAMADVVTRCPATRTARRTAHVESAAPVGVAATEPLYSWVIARAARAQVAFA
jgi:hypothetical protein